MNKQDTKYWLEELDRIGLLLVGIFLGGLIELIGIPRLSVIISVALLIPLGVVTYLIKISYKKGKEKK